MLPIAILIPLLTLPTSDSDSGNRCSVVALRDLNGDGITDIAIAERGNGPFGFGVEVPRNHTGRTEVERDRVWVLSGADGSPLRCLQAPQPCPEFGRVLARAGDLDGDGLDELAVAGRSRTWVFSASDGKVLFELTSPLADPGRVDSIAGGRDVDGDGKPDLLVLLRGDRSSHTIALLYSGSSGRLARVMSTETGGELAVDGATWVRLEGTTLGYAATLLDDRDGDGFAEVAVAVRSRSGIREKGGSGSTQEVVQVLGQGAAEVIETWRLPDERGGTAWVIADPGDLDGDGRRDLLVSVPNSYVAALVEGGECVIRIHDYRGGYMVYEGTSLEALEDQDGDGVRDYLIAANEETFDCDPGFAAVISGATGEEIARRNFSYYPDSSGCGPGVDACALDDVDGDGLGEYVLHLPRDQAVLLCSGKSLETVWKKQTELLRLPGVPWRWVNPQERDGAREGK